MIMEFVKEVMELAILLQKVENVHTICVNQNGILKN
nr:MAG TPA: hypothetical protein [Caudoviricetes sp.]